MLDRNAKITITRHADDKPHFCRALDKGITSNTAALRNQMTSSTAAEPNLPTTPEGVEEMFDNSSDEEIKDLYKSWMLDSMIDVYKQGNAEGGPAGKEKSEEMADPDWYIPSAFATDDDPFAGAAPGTTVPFKQDIADGVMEMVEAAANLGEPIISPSGTCPAYLALYNWCFHWLIEGTRMCSRVE